MNDKYLTYDALELAQDDAFIQWVKNGDSPMPEEWDKWLGQHPEKREEMEEARLIVQSILIKEAPVSEERISLLWEKIDAATEERAVRAKVFQLRPYRWLGYAAAAALALLIDLDRCTRCDECVRACSDAHGGHGPVNAVPRNV